MASTLDEINAQMVKMCYNILHYLQPDRWKNMSQVVYYPTNDRPSHFVQYQRVNKVDSVEFPFATVVRSPDIEPSLSDRHSGYKSNAVYYDSSSENGIRIMPVSLFYNFLLYENHMKHTENFIDAFWLDAYNSDLVFDYESAVMNSINRVSVLFPDAPTYEEQAGHSERTSGDGHIFSVNVPIKADTLLGRKAAPKLIQSVSYEMRIKDEIEDNFDGIDHFEDEREGILVSPITRHIERVTLDIIGNRSDTILSIDVTDGGSGYTTAPSVNISRSGSSIRAEAMATVSGGEVTGIELVSSGSGYTSTPTITLVGGGGSGATATANISPRDGQYERISYYNPLVEKSSTFTYNEANSRWDSDTPISFEISRTDYIISSIEVSEGKFGIRFDVVKPLPESVKYIEIAGNLYSIKSASLGGLGNTLYTWSGNLSFVENDPVSIRLLGDRREEIRQVISRLNLSIGYDEGKTYLGFDSVPFINPVSDTGLGSVNGWYKGINRKPLTHGKIKSTPESWLDAIVFHSANNNNNGEVLIALSKMENSMLANMNQADLNNLEGFWALKIGSTFFELDRGSVTEEGTRAVIKYIRRNPFFEDIFINSEE